MERTTYSEQVVINNLYDLIRKGKDKYEWYKEAANIEHSEKIQY